MCRNHGSRLHLGIDGESGVASQTSLEIGGANDEDESPFMAGKLRSSGGSV